MLKITITDREYRHFCQFLEAKCGIVLGENKHYLIKSRLAPLLETYHFSSIQELFQQLIVEHHSPLTVDVIDAMTTNETLWFRDNYPFDNLVTMIIPELIKTQNTLRIWSAASSSGQEPYSIAMSLHEALAKNRLLNLDIEIVATDISSSMLESCRLGIYDSLALERGLTDEHKAHFFDDLNDGRMQIKENIRNWVTFKSHNLTESYAALGTFDVIFCRNVLIYFSSKMKIQVLNQMAQSLHSGGYLILGASESLIGCSNQFKMVHCKPGLMYRKT